MTCESTLISDPSSFDLFATDVIADTWDFSVKHNFDHQAVVGSLKSLLTDLYVTEEVLSVTYYTLSSEAESIVKDGSPEFVVSRLCVSLLLCPSISVSVYLFVYCICCCPRIYIRL
jgi:hypothetical protein